MATTAADFIRSKSSGKGAFKPRQDKEFEIYKVKGYTDEENLW